MDHNITALRIFLDNHGVTAIEYALIAGLIAAVIIGTVAMLGNGVLLAYNSATNF
ncbi:Flp family type IVb pilin [Acidiphilium sp. PA]|uniref:Flp family type IVb pilin n=1 Tax=Acidiphilium sp. PA TaxID=2871705 RepID=UPI002243D731|nr:Flp family type IVb pilin [Acidiphilium sp. PA]MCW8305599.1 Flp family type IVb pilin [Acidiphilium sp. PA]